MASSSGLLFVSLLVLPFVCSSLAAEDSKNVRRLLEIRAPERPAVKPKTYPRETNGYPQEPGPMPTFKSSQNRNAPKSLPASQVGTSTATTEAAAENETFKGPVELAIPKKWVKALKVVFSTGQSNGEQELPEDRVMQERGDGDNLNRGFTTEKEAFLVPEWTSNPSEAATWIDVVHLPMKMGNLEPIGVSQGTHIYVSSRSDPSQPEKVTGVSLCRMGQSKLRWSRECCAGLKDWGRGNVWQTADLNAARGGDKLHVCFSVEPAGMVLSAKLPLGEIDSE